MRKIETAAVLGSGSWGTALADHLARNGKAVTIWGIDPAVVAEVNSQHTNRTFFPDNTLSASIKATTSFEEALGGADLIVAAVPSFAMREVAKKLKAKLADDVIVVSVAKGLEDKTFLPMTDVLSEEVGKPERIAALSGPSFALEVLKGLPTAVTVCSTSSETCRAVTEAFHCGTFRVYTSHDLVGVQLGAAVKNVIALAVGVVDGVGMGANARAALITRGLAEMQRLIVAAGGDRLTVSGLSGLGDLLLTATGDLSRNRRVGLRLGRGEKLEHILKDIGQVAEGVETTHKVLELAKRLNVDMPIVEEAHRIIAGDCTAQESAKALLSRAPRAEM